MAEIYLCDDEPCWVERMDQAVSDYIVGSNWALTVICRATEPYALLDCLSRHRTSGGIYFLDINLKADINGIELGAEIRERDPDAVLIFVTIHDELVMDTFRLKLQATDYIIKDNSCLRSQIGETLRTVEARYHHSAKKLSAPRIRLDADGSYHFVIKDDIYFVETEKNQHRLFVHLRAEMFSLSMSLKDVAELLGDDFILCRRGCLINPQHVSAIHRDTREIVFDNRESCCCSRQAWPAVLEKIGS